MKVFYHDDADGKAAAHCVYLYAKDILKEEINKEDFFPVNYGSKIPTPDVVNKGETVFIVDYSFTVDTIDILTKISIKANENVYWYDHHKSSIEIEGFVTRTHMCAQVIIDNNRSGAKIAYDALINGTELANDTFKQVIDLVDDYDRWIHNNPDSLLFNNGFIIFKNGPTDKIWHSDPTNVIRAGNIIKKYKNINNTKILNNSKYFITINDMPCIVLNTPEKSSQTFVKLYDEIGLAIRWSFDGKEYEYSIYSSLPCIDASIVARYFDKTGGGHRGAAGFRSKTLLIKDGNSFRIRMPKGE